MKKRGKRLSSFIRGRENFIYFFVALAIFFGFLIYTGNLNYTGLSIEEQITQENSENGDLESFDLEQTEQETISDSSPETEQQDIVQDENSNSDQDLNVDEQTNQTEPVQNNTSPDFGNENNTQEINFTNLINETEINVTNFNLTQLNETSFNNTNFNGTEFFGNNSEGNYSNVSGSGVVGGLNISGTNVTEVIPIVNVTETNQTNLSEDYAFHGEVTINQPVKWTRIISLDEAVDYYEFYLPINATNVTFLGIEENSEISNVTEVLVEQDNVERPIETTNLVTGGAVVNLEKVYYDFVTFLNNIFSFTGFAVYQESQVDSIKVIIDQQIKDLTIEYYLPGPESVETNLSEWERLIEINQGAGYENIIMLQDIDNLEISGVNLYKINNDSKEIVDFNYTETNVTGIINQIQWIADENETYKIEINIINVQSYPTVGGNWTVYFDTLGQANLSVRTFNGTVWSNETEDGDLKFNNVFCGQEVQNSSWNNQTVNLNNYYCNSTSKESSKVITQGKHNLEFRFGNNIKYAFNDASDSWFDSAWEKRRQINVTNTYGDLSEYQVRFTFDSESLINSGLMNNDCRDIRITNSSGGLLAYYVDESPRYKCDTNNTLVWIQTDTLLNDTINRFYMYYNNSGATSLSNLNDTFNYVSPKPIYYTVGENVYDGSIALTAYQDNTNVVVSGSSATLDKRQIQTFTTGQYGGTGSSQINTTGPLIGGDSSTSIGAEFNPISWASTEFVIADGRGNFDLYFYSPFQDITINCYDATYNAGSWGGIEFSTNCNAGSACSETSKTWSSNTDIYCNSTAPFLMYAQVGGNSNFPVYPVADNVWAISDSRTGVAYNDVNIDYLASDGATSSGNSPSADIGVYYGPNDGNDGSGLAWHYVASIPSLGSNEHADGDGSENSAYLPEIELEKEYLVYKNGDYFAMSITTNNTYCELESNSGTYVDQSNTFSGTVDYPYPTKGCFGCGADSQRYEAGAGVSCENTWGGGWETTGDDESTLYGQKSGRQYVWPEPVVTFEDIPEDPPVEGDFVNPEVTINFPQNATTYYKVLDLPFNFNVSLNENGTVEYSLDGGITNYSMNTDDNQNFYYEVEDLNVGTYTFNVYSSDISGNRNDTEFVIFDLVQENIILNGTVVDSNGDPINTTLIVFDDIASEYVYNETNVTHETILPTNTTYTINVQPLEILPVDDIEFDSLNLSLVNETVVDLVNIDEAPTFGNFSDVFSINTSVAEITNITVSFNATSNSIFRCLNWDFENELCLGNWTLFMEGLNSGEEYNFTLDNSNSGYGIINITDAIHLDDNRSFVNNIYEQVRELDGNWSETIYQNEYVRVTFAQNLTSINDITIYPRTVSGTPSIDVYEIDGNEIIAQFDSITDNQYNKVYLTSLASPQTTFDLKILNGDVEFDHIIDPSAGFTGDTRGLAVYGLIDVTDYYPVSRIWNGSNFEGQTITSPELEDRLGAPEWITVLSSPRRNQTAVSIVDSEGDIAINVYNMSNNQWINSTGWWRAANVGTSYDNYPLIDISVEDDTGDFLFVYEYTTANNRLMGYSTFDGSSLTGLNTFSFNSDAASEPQRVVRASRAYPGTSEILVAFAGTADDLSFARWDGNTFTNITTITLAAAAVDENRFDISWESNTQDAILTWGDALGVNYSYWSNVTKGFNVTNDRVVSRAAVVQQVDTCSNPVSDYIGLFVGPDSTSDTLAMMWDGNSWAGTPIPAEDGGAENSASLNAVCSWTTNSSIALFVYDATSNAPTLGWFIYNQSSNSWSCPSNGQNLTSLNNAQGSGGPCQTTNAMADDIETFTIHRDPRSNDIMFIGEGLTRDLEAWIFNSTTGLVQPTTSVLTSNGASCTTVGSCLGFDYLRYFGEQQAAPNTAPNTSIPILYSFSYTNLTSEDLYCNFTISDPELNNLNATVRWYNNSVLALTSQLNSNYASGTNLVSILGSGNTTPGEFWYCNVSATDGALTSNWSSSNTLRIVEATEPTIVWQYPTPANGGTISETSVTLNTTITDNIANNNISAFFDFNNSLKGYWSFDETNSSGAYDNSTYGKMLMFQNGLGESNLNYSGAFGNAITLDASNDYLSVGSTELNSLFDLGSNFTLEVWFNTGDTPASGQWDWIVAKPYTTHTAPYYIFDVQLAPNGYLTSTLYQNGSGLAEFLRTNFNSPVNDSKWHQVVIIGKIGLTNTSSNSLTMYVDGIFRSEDTTTTGSYSNVNTNVNFGRNPNVASSVYAFNGSLDEIRIHNRALSEGEILASYNHTYNRLNTTFLNLQDGFYTYGAYAIDSFGNLNKSYQNFTINTTPAGPSTYYVSPTGDDIAGDGSNGNPWKTLGSAIYGINKVNDGDTIIMKDGNYTENSTAFNAIYTDLYLTIKGETVGGANLVCQNCTVTDNPVLYLSGSGGSTLLQNINITNNVLNNHCLWVQGSVQNITLENISTYNCRDGIRLNNDGGSITTGIIKGSHIETNYSSGNYAIVVESSTSNVDIVNNSFSQKVYLSLSAGTNINFLNNNYTGDLRVDQSFSNYSSQINLNPRSIWMQNVNFPSTYYLSGYNWILEDLNQSLSIIQLNNVSNLVVSNNSFGNETNYLYVHDRALYTLQAVDINLNSKDILVDNNTFYLKDVYAGVYAEAILNSGTMTNLTLNNNRLHINYSRYGLEIRECFNSSRITNNIAYSSTNNASHTFGIGREDDRVGYECYGLKRNVNMSGNRIYSSADGSYITNPNHAIFVGHTDNFTVENNYVYGGTYNYVIKSNSEGIVKNNFAVNATYNGILHKGGSYVNYTNNTIIGNPSYADSWLLPIYVNTEISNESNVTNLVVEDNILSSNSNIIRTSYLYENISVLFRDNVVTGEGGTAYDIKGQSNLTFNDSIVQDSYDLIKLGSVTNITNFTVNNYSSYYFKINQTIFMNINVTNNSLMFNIYNGVSSGAYTTTVQLYNLSESLVYNTNGSVYGSQNISSNNNNINFTIAPLNTTYLLNDFKLNESKFRYDNPINLSGSATFKNISSSLVDYINVTLIHTVSQCSIYSYTTSFDYESYGCSNNEVTLTGAQISNGYSNITINYDGPSCTYGTSPPASGTWTVSDNTLCENMEIALSQDSDVLITGNLTLTNVNLTLDPSVDGGANITVYNGGKFVLNVSNSNQLNRITSTSTANEYTFVAYNSSYLRIDHANLSEIGWTTALDTGGLYITTKNVSIYNTNFVNNFRAFIINVLDSEPADIHIANVTISNSGSNPFYIWDNLNGALFENVNVGSTHPRGMAIGGYNNTFINLTITDTTGAVGATGASVWRRGSGSYAGLKRSYFINSTIINGYDEAYTDSAADNFGDVFINSHLETYDRDNNDLTIVFSSGAGGQRRITFVNTTFNKSDTSTDSLTTLDIRWYLDVNVKDSSGNLENAWANITNNTGMIVNRSLTNSQGNINRLNLTEYLQTSSGYFYETNYTVNGSATSHKSNKQDVNLTQSYNISIYLNQPPGQVSLNLPEHGNITTNRTPTLSWNSVTDSDGDSVEYTLLVDDDINFGAPEVSINTSSISYTLSSDLDLDTTYYWKVRAYDDIAAPTQEDYGQFSSTRNFTVQSLVVATLTTNTIDFGIVNRGVEYNTSDGSPGPFVIRNDGNGLLNVSLYSTQLFDTTPLPNESYRFKANQTSEINSFSIVDSIMSFFNMPSITGQVVAIGLLKYPDVNDEAALDISITVPNDEEAISKSATVTFEESLAE